MFVVVYTFCMQVSPPYMSMFPPSITIPIIIFLASFPAIIFNLYKKKAFAVHLFAIFVVGSFFYISRFYNFSYLFDLRGFVLLASFLLTYQTISSSIGKVSIGTFLFGLLAIAVGLLTNEPKLVVGIAWLFLALSINKLLVGFKLNRRYRPRNRLFFWLPVLFFQMGMVFSYSRNIDQAIDIFVPITFLCTLLVLLSNHLPDVKFIIRETFRYLLLWLYSTLLVFAVFWFVHQYLLEEYLLLIFGLVLVLYLMTFQNVSRFVGSSFIRIFSQTHTPTVELIRDMGIELRNVTGLEEIAFALEDFLKNKCHANGSALIMVDHGLSTIGGQEFGFRVQAAGGQVSNLVLPADSPLLDRMGAQGGYFYHSDLEGEEVFQEAGEKPKKWFTDLQAELYIPVQGKNGLIALLAVLIISCPVKVTALALSLS